MSMIEINSTFHTSKVSFFSIVSRGFVQHVVWSLEMQWSVETVSWHLLHNKNSGRQDVVVVELRVRELLHCGKMLLWRDLNTHLLTQICILLQPLLKQRLLVPTTI